jgi:glycine hydroxymethyltransferase
VTVPAAPGASDVVDRAVEQLNSRAPASIAHDLRRLVDDQQAWRDSRVTLLAGEGLMSRSARRPLDSDLASRLSEGLPGDKDPALPAVLHPPIERIEAVLVAAVRSLFGSAFVEWRPPSNTMANAAALRATTRRGDLIAVQAMSAGANISYQTDALAGLLGLRTTPLPGTPDFGIDIEPARELIRHERPRAVVIGGSKVLFPYPVRQLRAVADEVGATLIYDAAHVGPLIAAGIFDSPLSDGAHVMTTGTHKLMGGPPGGLVLTDDPLLATRIADATYPALLQTRDLNKLASAATAMLELVSFNSVYAPAVVANARTLADALARRGHRIVAAERGGTRTHQFIVQRGRDAPDVVARCAANGILISCTAAYGEDPARGERHALRISVAQATRKGMGADDMRHLAELIDAAAAGEDVTVGVRALAHRFVPVQYSFDEENQA